jgi:type IV secretion system protein VirB8
MALFKRNLSEATEQVLKKSMDFESNVIESVKRSERRAWIVAICSMVLTLMLGGWPLPTCCRSRRRCLIW